MKVSDIVLVINVQRTRELRCCVPFQTNRCRRSRRPLFTMRLRELVAGQLAAERDELRAVYHFFCGAGQREMCLSGFLRFCDAFSLSPGYLGPDKVEEIFENCA